MTADAHGIFVWVAGSVTAAFIVALVVFIRKGWNTLMDVQRFMLPHFQPPSESEIRSGAIDRTIPARIKDLEEGQAENKVWRDQVDRRIGLSQQPNSSGLGA